MRAKSINVIFKALTIVAFATSCAKTSYDGSQRLRLNENNANPPAQQQGRSGVNPDTGNGGALPATKLPVISFVQSQVLMDSKLEAKLELQLSEKSNVPVVAKIDLLNDSARHERDFNGFKTPSRNNETSQTVVFAPGETRKSLPTIGGIVRHITRSGKCNSEFVARIDAWTLQNARVLNDRSNISVPCLEMPTQPPPAPIEPEPPTPPVPVEPPFAQFEKDTVVAEPNVDVALARIVLNKAAPAPVFIEIETQGVMGAAAGYVPLKERYMIPAGESSKDIPVKIFRDDICKHDLATKGVVIVAEFNIVATDVKGANMPVRTARLIVKDDNSKCQPPAPPIKPEPPSPPPAPQLPVARFERSKIKIEVKNDKAKQVVARILLDKVSAQDVNIELETQDGLAKADIDYVPLKTTVTIKAGTGSIDIPISLVAQACRQKADGRNPKEDDKDFTLNVTSIVNAEMPSRTAKIVIDQDIPLCKPVIINARFESTDLKNARGSVDIMAKIILSQASKEAVVLDVETQEGTAKQDVDFVRVAQQLTINPGETSINIPLKLIKKEDCVPSELAASLNIKKQFNLTVSNIKNAVMAEPVALVTVIEDLVLCPPAPKPPEPPAPPVTSPAPAPKPPEPPAPPVTSPAPAPKPPEPPAPPVTSPAPAPKPPEPPAPPVTSPAPAPKPPEPPAPPVTSPAPKPPEPPAPPVTSPAPKPPVTSPAPKPPEPPAPPVTSPAPAPKPPVKSPAPAPKPPKAS